MWGSGRTRPGLDGLSLRRRIGLCFAALGLGWCFCLALGLILAAAHGGSALVAALAGGAAGLGVTLLVWRFFDDHVARPVEALASGLRARAHGGATPDLAGAAPYLGDLGPAAGALAGTLSAAEAGLATALGARTAEISGQLGHLSTLLADVPVGVICCGPDHRVVFYNPRARDLLAGSGQIRLARRLGELLDPGPLERALGRLRSGAPHAEAQLATIGDGRMLSAHLRLTDPGQEASGYVLTLRCIASDLAWQRQSEAELTGLMAELDGALADLRNTLHRPETRAAADRVAMASARIDALRWSWWPMQEVDAADLLAGLRAHPGASEVAAGAVSGRLWCDAAGLGALLAELSRWASPSGPLRLDILPGDGRPVIRLDWAGAMPADLAARLAAPLPGAELTGQQMLDRHRATLETGAHGLTLHLGGTVPGAPAAPEAERRAIYDFALLGATRHDAIDALPLSKLTYVVFDTETTGLDTARDEIVQLAALRILNGRIIPGEELDLLVDPGRPIPPSASRVHGVTDDMVRGRPGIAVAGARLRRFSENAVLVAHNAPFDLAFFHRHQTAIGGTLDNPVLDTVLISAILFGPGVPHTLDALCDRLGVALPAEARHTAMGDTRATAEVLLRMLPMLQVQGLTTYRQVLAAMQKQNRLMRAMQSRAGN